MMTASSLPSSPTQRAPLFHQIVGIQIVCRSHQFSGARPTGRRGRPQWLRQVEHHRRRALGAGRIEGLRAAWRVDAGRDLQWLDAQKARRALVGRAGVRQQCRQGCRPVGPVRRDRGQAHAYARWHLNLLHQRPAGASARHPGHLPGHGPGPACLRHHRPGHDFADHRVAPRRTARVPRRGGRRLQIQGTPA
jgi:hypothetical protein